MTAELLLLSSFFFTGLSILIIPWLPASYKSTTALILVILSATATSVPAVQALLGKDFSILLYGGHNLGVISVRIDALSSWFILIINLTLVNGALYGSGYMRSYKNRKNDLSLHWISYVVFHTSMLWVCMLQNGFAFLVAWEIMTLSSLMLILFEHEKANTQQAGLNYLVQMHIGVAMLSLAFIWVFLSENTMSFAGISSFLQHNKGYWVIALFFLGFGIKAGFVPLHTWLPYAHPAAPSHVSGVMSGVIVKMGIYGILRIAVMISQDILLMGVILVIISTITTLYGILNASVHRDFKKMLAFCTTENIGIIGMGTGLMLVGKGTGNNMIMVLGFSAALLHTLNHSLYKSLLFFSAGNIYQQTHTRNMEHLGGLVKYMPHTAVIFLTGALAIGGLPPLNGFVSKFLIYSGFVETFKYQDISLSALMIISTAILSLAGGVSMLAFSKTFGTVFLGSPRIQQNHKPVEVSLSMRMPLYFIIGIMVAIGLAPNLVLTPVFTIIKSLGTETLVNPFAGIAHTLSWVGKASLILLALTMVVYLFRRNITRKKPAEMAPTWGCGYVAPGPEMQYTGKSFSKSLAKLFGFITIENKKYDELSSGSIFPAPRTYASFYLEFFETRVFEPVTRQFLRLFNYFVFIHNGKIQLYVLYGFFFVIVLIILSFIHVL